MTNGKTTPFLIIDTFFCQQMKIIFLRLHNSPLFSKKRFSLSLSILHLCNVCTDKHLEVGTKEEGKQFDKLETLTKYFTALGLLKFILTVFYLKHSVHCYGIVQIIIQPYKSNLSQQPRFFYLKPRTSTIKHRISDDSQLALLIIVFY